MRKGIKVQWHLKTGELGFGETISEEEDGRILVAVESDGELKYVIYCAVDCLTVIEEK